LGNVRASTMAADPRHDLVAWRWELELMPQSKASVKASRIRPLFTFLAVPAKGSTSASTLSDGGLQPAGELANSLSTAPVVNH